MFLGRFFKRLCKLTAYILGFWLILVIFWLALPFPTRSDDHFSNQLVSGKPVTRVYAKEHFWSAADGLESVRNAYRQSRWFVGVEYRVIKDEETGGLLLQLGGGVSPIDPEHTWTDLDPFTNVNISLSIPSRLAYPPLTHTSPHHAAAISIPWQQEEEMHFDDESDVTLSPGFEVVVATGDDDGINPPWFSKGDSAMLFWWIHHDVITIPLRVRSIRSQRKIEVWPDSSQWTQLPYPPGTIRPLITIHLSNDSDNSSFSVESSPIFTFPQPPFSEALSVSYPLRVVIQLFLVPIGLFYYTFFHWIRSLIVFIVQIVVALLTIAINLLAIAFIAAVAYGAWWWYKHDRPPVRDVVARGARWAGVRVDWVERNAPVAQDEEPLVDLEAQTPVVPVSHAGSEAEADSALKPLAPALRSALPTTSNGSSVTLVDVTEDTTSATK